jgi:hypothetical protein
VGKIGVRDYIVGLIFGERVYTQAELDREIDGYVAGEFLQPGGIEVLVKQLLHNPAVLESHPFIPEQYYTHTRKHLLKIFQCFRV